MCITIFLLFSFFNFTLDFHQNPVDNRFYCNICGRNYARKKHAHRHVRYECINIPPRFHCEPCTKQYRQSNALLHHIRQKHGPLARDTDNATGFTQQNFNVSPDGGIIFTCLQNIY